MIKKDFVCLQQGVFKRSHPMRIMQSSFDLPSLSRVVVVVVVVVIVVVIVVEAVVVMVVGVFAAIHFVTSSRSTSQ